ncbi:MAG: hypothetical protein M1113_04510, partial [Candidatus Thermoplasmatota archaeon]|nr:hypothetical protein [Candidatus Thermoplasmatota archaeon]
YKITYLDRRAKRNNRRKLIVGKSYKITYLDRSTVKTERIIDVRERKRKYITAYCHLRNAVRTFKRSRIKSIEPYLIITRYPRISPKTHYSINFN